MPPSSRLIVQSAGAMSRNPIKVVGRSITGPQRWDYRHPPWVRITSRGYKGGLWGARTSTITTGRLRKHSLHSIKPPPYVVVVILLKNRVPRVDYYLMVVPVFSLLSIGGNNESPLYTRDQALINKP
ncbi:hypothetical protein NPIL_360931 [Nephila pilipes]|uniref:Uncharacterized protein n=1 Tax=Nephila pilipes TaxID=299642 RepID=A0A8X6TRJ3_NEPPI|nr:hypothetical protein NPIL_360931 [Nephila pilipes]